MSLRISSLVVAALGVGCVTGDLDTSTAGEPQTNDVHQELGCPEFMCGMNSPQIAQFGFWDLNMPPSLDVPGLANNVGLQLLGFLQGGQLYLPRVNEGRLTASRVDPTDPTQTITVSGTGLVNGILLLLGNGKPYGLRVSEVGYVQSWATPVTSLPTRRVVMLESYKLDWSAFVNGQFGDFRNMCTNPPIHDRTNDDTLGMTGSLAYHTLLFEGDRIDASKKLDTGIDTTWFNLGCAGSALAKMALTGHTEGSRRARTFSTTLAERQTILKMFAADYCGDGTPFTVPGQPLNWMDDHGTMKLQSSQSILSFESRWNASGAACLSKPRVDVMPTSLSISTLGTDVYDQVMAHCPARALQPCDPSFDTEGSHLLSATPI